MTEIYLKHFFQIQIWTFFCSLICCSLPKFCNSKLSMFYKAIISSPLKLRGKFLMPRFFSNLPNCKDAFLDNSDPSRSNSNVHQDRWTQHTSIKSPLQLRSCILDIQLQRSWRKGVFPKIPSVLLYKYLTHLENFVTIRNNFFFKSTQDIDKISRYSYKNNKNKRKVYGTRHIYNILLEVSIRT